MRKADRLSRRPDQKVRVENDNNNQVFIKNCWLHSIQEVVIEEPEVDILEKIKKAKSKNKEIVRVVEEMKKYMPKNRELKTEIIQLYYDILVARHGGR